MAEIDFIGAEDENQYPNRMHVIIDCVRRWNLIDGEAIELILQSAKQVKKSIARAPEQIQRLLAEWLEPVHTR